MTVAELLELADRDPKVRQLLEEAIRWQKAADHVDNTLAADGGLDPGARALLEAIAEALWGREHDPRVGHAVQVAASRTLCWGDPATHARWLREGLPDDDDCWPVVIPDSIVFGDGGGSG
jgi:hypothetical protein